MWYNVVGSSHIGDPFASLFVNQIYERTFTILLFKSDNGEPWTRCVNLVDLLIASVITNDMLVSTLSPLSRLRV